ASGNRVVPVSVPGLRWLGEDCRTTPGSRGRESSWTPGWAGGTASLDLRSQSCEKPSGVEIPLPPSRGLRFLGLLLVGEARANPGGPRSGGKAGYALLRPKQQSSRPSHAGRRTANTYSSFPRCYPFCRCGSRQPCSLSRQREIAIKPFG